MTKLNYCPAAPPLTDDEPHTLRFPGGVRDVVGRPDPRRMSREELADSMELTLDRMQNKLERIRAELDGAYHLTAADDDTRPAA